MMLRCSAFLFVFLAVGLDAEAQITIPACSDGLDNDGDGFIDFPADPNCTSPDDNSESPRFVDDAGGNGSDAGSQFDAANNLDFGLQVDAGDGGLFIPTDGSGPATGQAPGAMLGNGESPPQDRGCQMLGRGPGGPLFPALLFGMVMAWYSGRTRRRR